MAPSGEFNGELLIRYQGDELSVPVIVKVKDPWLLPFLTLLTGVGLSMAVSAYSIEGKQRDEITVSMIQLRTQIDEDKQGKEKATPFWSRAYMHLEDAKLAHYTKQWEESEKALVEARTVWNKWYRNREEWLIQIIYYEDLQKRLEEPDLKNSPSRYIQAVKRSLDDTFQRLPDFTSPIEIRQILAGIGDRIDRYLKWESQLDKINNFSQQIQENEKRYEWEDKIRDLEEKLQEILPSEQTELENLEKDINNLIAFVKKDLSGQPIQVVENTKLPTTIVPQPPSSRPSKNIDTGKTFTTNSIVYNNHSALRK